MRPHRLRLRAFGPFPDEVEVDLDALAAGGLFLLHGETGAGKTTLLDGIGFALYGRVPGVRGKTGRLRSDHADPGVRTEVELEVTLGGRRWRITRSPMQERPKKSGNGFTIEQAAVRLDELRGAGWETVSTRIDEAAAELDPLLGMSADQFFQVVLLPQGEFARFLRADSKDRGELLQRLFATERFKAVEDWLVARRISTASAVTAARNEIGLLAARLAQAAGVDVPEELPEQWATCQLQELTVGLEAARAAAVQAAGLRDACRLSAADATRVHALQARRTSALAARDALQAARSAHDALRAELRTASRAAELVAVLDEAAERQATAVAAGTAEASARALLAPVGLPLDADTAALTAAADGARRRSGRLESLRGVADALAAEQEQQAAAEQEAAAAATRLDALRVELAELPAQRAAARDAVTSAQAAVEQLPGVEARAGLLATARREAGGLQVAATRLEQLREMHVLARETLVSLREKEHDLREARFVSMVAELADRLEDGSPCEVCGATSHPDPYLGDGEGVTRDDEDRARLEAEHAARQVAEVEARLAAESATAEGHRTRLADTGFGDLGPAELERLWQEVQQELAELRRSAGELAGWSARLEQLDAAQVAAEASRAREEGDLAGASRRAGEAQARAQAHELRLREELDGAADLGAALELCDAVSSACDAVREATAAAGRASAEAVRAAGAAATAATAAGFVDVAAARQALRPASWREDAEQRLRADDDERAAVEAVLAEPELAELPAQPVDLAAVTAAVREADAQVRAAAGAEAAAAERLRQVADLVPALAAALEALRPLEERATHVRRLADLCTGGGGNALKMTLTSFVLAARLEEVAAVASGRLLRMTQGRYSLVHTDGAVKGGARAGLGLLARDSWTGQDRDTSTLSGGETFLASLALALGLADVVQAEAGGTRIEALFVDEGFGTLDEDTLDEVMDVLDGLREGGRVVGLVSHVAELRARIPAQVHVRKTRRGSSVSLLGC
jgi:exonuclease SbcC